MVRIAFHYLGCRLNEAENEALARQMIDSGHEIADLDGNPDVIVLNTCGVTADAMRKSRNLMRRFAAQGVRVLALMGCAVDLMDAGENPVSDEELLQQTADAGAPPLKIVRIRRSDRPHAAQIIARAAESLGDASEARPSAYKPRMRCFIKIEDGCNNRCTYCSVRLARGPERSVPTADIIAEIKRCLALGEREFVLAGVQLGAWKEGCRRLEHLIADILSQTDAQRLRLSSIEPWHLRPELYALWRDSRLCPHFHCPVQSGSDAVLAAMGRRTQLAAYEEKIADLRRLLPNARVSTDIIVGFPGETDAMFRETLAFIERVGFDDIHLFRFSPRPGTVAATLPDPVAPDVKRARRDAAHDLMTQVKRARMQRNLGALCRVLWESCDDAPKNGKLRWCGYAENYLRLYREFDENKPMRGTITCELFGENDIAPNLEQKNE